MSASVIAKLAARAGISYAAMQGRLRRCDGYVANGEVQISPEVEAEVLRHRLHGQRPGDPVEAKTRTGQAVALQRAKYDPLGKIAGAALAYHRLRFGADRAAELAAYRDLVTVLEPSILRYCVVRPKVGRPVIYRCVNGEIVCERQLGRKAVYAPTAHA